MLYWGAIDIRRVNGTAVNDPQGRIFSSRDYDKY